MRMVVVGVALASALLTVWVFSGPAEVGAESVPVKVENINYGKSCSSCDFNIKYGLACTKPDKDTCGEGSLEMGGGFCTAKKGETSGYCSSRCKEDAHCPSGWSCSDLSTGMLVCTQ